MPGFARALARDGVWRIEPSRGAARPRGVGGARLLPRAARLRRRAGHEAVARVRARAARGETLRLDRGDLVGGDAVLGHLGAQSVEARRVAAEDGALHGAVGGPQRLEAVLLLHVLRDLEPAQRLDLPLGRAVPE